MKETKPDWHEKWYSQNSVERMASMMCRCDYNSYKKERTLNPLIAEFFWETNRRLKK